MLFENKEKNKEITLIKSLTNNYLTWILIFTSIYVISYKNVFKGIFTFFFIFFLSYFTHLSSHVNVNVFSILHQYHHNNNNFFSHFIQYVIELIFPLFLLPFHFIFDIWIVLFSAIFYSSVHNINYGLLHVNDVHFLHHKDVFTNLGPDFCDVIFNTKNEKNQNVENTSHYIPNIIIITILICFLKFMCLNKNIEKLLLNAFIFFQILLFLFYVVASIYVCDL